MYYLIDTILRKCSKEEFHVGEGRYVAVLTPEEWLTEKDSFEMGIDLEPEIQDIFSTNA